MKLTATRQCIFEFIINQRRRAAEKSILSISFAQYKNPHSKPSVDFSDFSSSYRRRGAVNFVAMSAPPPFTDFDRMESVQKLRNDLLNHGVEGWNKAW